MWRRAGGRLVGLTRFSPLVTSSKVQCEGKRSISSLPGLRPSRIMLATDKIMDEEDLQLTTGFEREQMEYKRQGKARFDIDAPRGPFGTEEAPAIIQSRFDERIVGCPGGTGDDEHDVLWFRLKKGKRHVCKICGQVFELEVVGPGGPPGGHH